MNPKDEEFFCIPTKTFTNKDNYLNEYQLDELIDDENLKLESFLQNQNQDFKNFVQNILETSVFDTNFLPSIQTRQDWLHLRNKLNDKTLEILLTDPIEFWNCSKFYLQLFDQLTEQKKDPEYGNDDDFLIYFDNIKSIKTSILILLKRFIFQMNEEIIIEIIDYCRNHISQSKEVSSLLLSTFKYPTIPSELVLQNAFQLEGRYFVKAYLLINERFPDIPLNTPNFYKRIIEIHDVLIFKALDCGSFSDTDLLNYDVIEFLFSLLDYYNNNDINIKNTIRDQFIYLIIKFMTQLFKRTNLFSKYYIRIIEISKNMSMYTKTQILKLFDLLLPDLSNDSIIDIIHQDFITILIELLQIGMEKDNVIILLKLLHYFIDYSITNEIDFYYQIMDFYNVDSIKEDLENIQEQYSTDEFICQLIQSIIELLEINDE